MKHYDEDRWRTGSGQVRICYGTYGYRVLGFNDPYTKGSITVTSSPEENTAHVRRSNSTCEKMDFESADKISIDEYLGAEDYSHRYQ